MNPEERLIEAVSFPSHGRHVSPLWRHYYVIIFQTAPTAAIFLHVTYDVKRGGAIFRKIYNNHWLLAQERNVKKGITVLFVRGRQQSFSFTCTIALISFIWWNSKLGLLAHFISAVRSKTHNNRIQKRFLFEKFLGFESRQEQRGSHFNEEQMVGRTNECHDGEQVDKMDGRVGRWLVE